MKTKKLLFILILLTNTYTFTILNRRVDLRSPEGGTVTIFHDVHECHQKNIIQEQLAACKRIMVTNPLMHIEFPLNAKQTDLDEKFNRLAKQDKIEFLSELSKVIWKNEPNDKFFVTDPRTNFMLFCHASCCVELIGKIIPEDQSLQVSFTKKVMETFDNPKFKLFDCLGELEAKMVAHIEKLNPDLFSVELAELIEYHTSFKRLIDQYQSLGATEKAEFSSRFFIPNYPVSFYMVGLLKNIYRHIVHLIEFDYYDFILHHSSERIYIFTGAKHGVNLEVMLTKAGFERIYETCAKNYYIKIGQDVNLTSLTGGSPYLDRILPLTSEQILHGLEVIIAESRANQLNEKDITSSDEGAHRCAACGSHEALKRCGRCKAVSYCDEICQRANWRVHKKECKQN